MAVLCRRRGCDKAGFSLAQFRPPVTVTRTPIWVVQVTTGCARHIGLSPSGARWRAREGKSVTFQASLARGRGGYMKLMYCRCAGLD
jgi:hypothetical protein